LWQKRDQKDSPPCPLAESDGAMHRHDAFLLKCSAFRMTALAVDTMQASLTVNVPAAKPSCGTS